MGVRDRRRTGIGSAMSASAIRRASRFVTCFNDTMFPRTGQAVVAILEQCCGFGGTFAIKNADTSIAMVSDKIRAILDTGAKVCVAADNSCLMHIGGALSRQRAGVRTMHIAEVFAQTERPPGGVVTDAARHPSFPEAARTALADTQLRHNLGHATHTIRAKRAAVVAEVPDWEQLREAGRALKERVLRHLDEHLLELESAVQRAGGVVHWARDAEECNRIVGDIIASHGVDEVVKAKSLTTEETTLNEALAQRGIRARETDLAQLIIQLGDDMPSHILVPAIHKNREQIRELVVRTLGDAPPGLTDDPRALAEVARRHLRRLFLDARIGISGVNFAIAQTGTVSVVESEGNGRMCTTLREVMISVMGIEKVIPTWQDLEVYPQLLPRSSTAERMNPYTSLWTGVSDGDGPQEFHLVLVDNGRTDVLADEVGRQALNCIRCSACLNVRSGRLGQWPPARGGTIDRLPGPLSGWTSARDLPAVPRQSFRDWWRERT
jgi:iron-sulfur cluster protein